MPNNPLDSRLDWDPSQGKDRASLSGPFYWPGLAELVRHNIERDIKRISETEKAAQMLTSAFNDAPKDRVAEAPVGLADLFEAYNDEHHAYHELACVLVDAYEQAAIGKGKERHANDRAFRDQPIHRTSDLLQSDDGINFQVIKKIEEAKRLPAAAAYKEALGAIVYTSAVAMRYQSRIESGDAK